jgi:hypothetical protein
MVGWSAIALDVSAQAFQSSSLMICHGAAAARSWHHQAQSTCEHIR